MFWATLNGNQSILDHFTYKLANKLKQNLLTDNHFQKNLKKSAQDNVEKSKEKFLKFWIKIDVFKHTCTAIGEIPIFTSLIFWY